MCENNTVLFDVYAIIGCVHEEDENKIGTCNRKTNKKIKCEQDEDTFDKREPAWRVQRFS